MCPASLLLVGGLLLAQTQQPVPQDPDKARLEGRVFNAVTGEPLRKTERSELADSATVTLVPTGSHRSRPFHKSITTDAAGHFTIRGIAPGSYKLFAWDKVDTNAVIYDPEFLRPYEVLGETIEVHSGEKKVLELKLIVNKEQ